MTDQPDTAAIRALLAVGIYVDYHDGLALCDALDAARAERDRLETLYGFQVGRADLEKARAEAAEARIADAMEEHAPRSTYGTGPADSLHPDDRMCRRCKAVYPCATVRALTGGTA